jgi:excisionase family DNA binding protein
MDEHENAVDLRRMAEMLNVSYAMVYGMAQRGEVPTFRVGRRWRMIPSKVIAHLEAKTASEEAGVMRQPPGSAAGHKAAATRRRFAEERERDQRRR